MSKESTMAENPTQSRTGLVSDGEIRLSEILIVLARNKKIILVLMIVAAVLAAGGSLLIPNRYTARTQILPPQSQSSSSALLGQLGALSALTGASMGLKNDMYVGLLTSRSILDRLILRFKLQSEYKTKFPTDTRHALEKSSSVSSAKNGMIIVEVTDKDPKLAAALANAYVEELQKMTATLAVTEASQRRLFFEKQLLQAKEGLADAEIAFKQAQEKSGLIQLSSQATGVIQAASQIKAQIASKEVALGAIRTFATTGNPEYIRAQQEIIGLRAQLVKIETGINNGKGDISIATGKVPEAGLEYMRRMRDVKYYESIYELLAKQFELAKIDEAKEGSVLQILDVAIEPDKKSGPPRTFITLGAALAAGFLTLCWAFIKEFAGKDSGRGFSGKVTSA